MTTGHEIWNCGVCGESHCCSVHAERDHRQWRAMDIEIVDETDRQYHFSGDEADEVWVDKP